MTNVRDDWERARAWLNQEKVTKMSAKVFHFLLLIFLGNETNIK